MQTTIAKYRDDPDLQNLIDFSQQFVSFEHSFLAEFFAELYGILVGMLWRNKRATRLGK